MGKRSTTTTGDHWSIANHQLAEEGRGDSLQFVADDDEREETQEGEVEDKIDDQPSKDLNQAGQEPAEKRATAPAVDETILRGFSFGQLGKRDVEWPDGSSATNNNQQADDGQANDVGQLQGDGQQSKKVKAHESRGAAQENGHLDPAVAEQILRGFSFGQLGKRDPAAKDGQSLANSMMNTAVTDQMLKGFSFGQPGKRVKAQKNPNPADADQILRGFSFGQLGKRVKAQSRQHSQSKKSLSPAEADQILRGFSFGQLGKRIQNQPNSGPRPVEAAQILRGFSFGQLGKRGGYNQGPLDPMQGTAGYWESLAGAGGVPDWSNFVRLIRMDERTPAASLPDQPVKRDAPEPDLSQREIGLVLRGFSFGQMGRRSAPSSGQATKRFLHGNDELMLGDGKELWDCGREEVEPEETQQQKPQEEGEQAIKSDNQFR